MTLKCTLQTRFGLLQVIYCVIKHKSPLFSFKTRSAIITGKFSCTNQALLYSLKRLLSITRICAAEMCLSFDCMQFGFFVLLHLHSNRYHADFRLKIRVIGKTRLRLQLEVESSTQGSRPRQRTQKDPRLRLRTALSRIDTLEAKDRNARGQGQEPRIQTHVFSKKKGLYKFFSGDLQKKKRSRKNFSADLQNFDHSKILLFSSREQGNF